MTAETLITTELTGDRTGVTFTVTGAICGIIFAIGITVTRGAIAAVFDTISAI